MKNPTKMWIYCNLGHVHSPPPKKKNNLKPLLFFGRRFFFLLAIPKGNLIFQPSIFSGHVSFREGNCDLNKWMELWVDAKPSGPPLFFCTPNWAFTDLKAELGWNWSFWVMFVMLVCIEKGKERLTKTGEKEVEYRLKWISFGKTIVGSKQQHPQNPWHKPDVEKSALLTKTEKYSNKWLTIVALMPTFSVSLSGIFSGIKYFLRVYLE